MKYLERAKKWIKSDTFIEMDDNAKEMTINQTIKRMEVEYDSNLSEEVQADLEETIEFLLGLSNSTVEQTPKQTLHWDPRPLIPDPVEESDHMTEIEKKNARERLKQLQAICTGNKLKVVALNKA